MYYRGGRVKGGHVKLRNYIQDCKGLLGFVWERIDCSWEVSGKFAES